jgi:hypothetical protein
MPTLLRRSDTLWLRLACLREEPFSDGIPWRLAPARFVELERRGLVEAMPTPKGLRALATEAGRARLAGIKNHLMSRKAVAHG